MNDYVRTIYDEKKVSFTSYPEKLINYLVERFKINKNSKILELGPGRGEFLHQFNIIGFDTYGVDQSTYGKDKYGLNITKVDLSEKSLPYENNYFDYIYSKSFIEHFYYPDKILSEAFRVLKPGGKIITLTPEWNYIYKSFYEDFSHRTPFTKVSLEDLLKITGFKKIYVESFKQLPILWSQNSLISVFFELISYITRKIVPDYFRMKYKWVRFSKEIMILSIAEK